MATTRFSVPGVHCNHCQSSIQQAVSKAEGVQRVEVDLASKQVTVDHGEEVTAIGEIKRLIEDQGYDVVSFEEISA